MFETFAEQVAQISATEWIGVASGLLAVWLSIKEKVLTWPLYIICYLSYALLSWEVKLYPFLGMNLIFIGLSAYGWRKWSRTDQPETADQQIEHCPKQAWLWISILCLVSTIGFGTLFDQYGAYLAYADAFAASVALSAQWMLGRRYLETWALWILSDIIYIGLWSAQAYWPTVGLFGIFIILAIKGYREWHQTIDQRSA
ncbi:MAG: nicotinamide riboside transporter PnuC [Verrucomicrobiota bacterium]